jgi:hypothetical protein
VSGNGVDIAAVYQLLREVADRVIAHDTRFAVLGRRLAEVQSDVGELRRTLTQYHASGLPVSDI